MHADNARVRCVSEMGWYIRIMFLLSYIIQEEERRHSLASLSCYHHHMIDRYDRSTLSAAAVTVVPPRLHVNW